MNTVLRRDAISRTLPVGSFEGPRAPRITNPAWLRGRWACSGADRGIRASDSGTPSTSSSSIT